MAVDESVQRCDPPPHSLWVQASTGSLATGQTPDNLRSAILSRVRGIFTEREQQLQQQAAERERHLQVRTRPHAA